MSINLTFRFKDCSVEKCGNAAVIDQGGCDRCSQHYCIDHRHSSVHTCKSNYQTVPLDDDAWEAAQVKELQSLRARVHHDNLLREASSANHDQECWLDDSDPLGRARMGGMNVHLRIEFANGSKWLARIPRENYTSFSDEITNQILLSECTTLQFLEAIGVPVPKLRAFGLRNDPANNVGVAYMLIEELPGEPLLHLDPSPQQLSKVYNSLADILCIIAKHPFDRIGSLTLADDCSVVVGAVASDRTGTLPIIGPFENACDYYTTWAKQYLDLIVDRQIFTDFSPGAYVIFKYIAEAAKAGKFNIYEKQFDDRKFFLKHMDDKGDHILVDKEFNITGIIDWSFARVVPAYEAFGPSLVTADMDSIYSGKPGTSNDDKLLADKLEIRDGQLARLARGLDTVRRLTFGLGMSMSMSWAECIDLFTGILYVLGEDTEKFHWDTWYQSQLKRMENDRALKLLTSQQ